jgi:hypothetical protein
MHTDFDFENDFVYGLRSLDISTIHSLSLFGWPVLISTIRAEIRFVEL